MLKINRVVSKSLLLIITDGRIRRMQIDKKTVFLPFRFGASSPQAIGVTRKLSQPFGLYLYLDLWCIMCDKIHFKFQCVTRMRALFSSPISPIAFRAKI